MIEKLSEEIVAAAKNTVADAAKTTDVVETVTEQVKAAEPVVPDSPLALDKVPDNLNPLEIDKDELEKLDEVGKDAKDFKSDKDDISFTGNWCTNGSCVSGAQTGSWCGSGTNIGTVVDVSKK